MFFKTRRAGKRETIGEVQASREGGAVSLEQQAPASSNVLVTTSRYSTSFYANSIRSSATTSHVLNN